MVTGFVAVANQAVASLERADALERAKHRQALAAVGEMAAGLAHEVRNPLGAIRGAAQVLTGGADGERAREMLEVIEDETERLGRVVGEFLDYARPDSPKRDRIDLVDLARRAIRSAETTGGAPRFELIATERPTGVGDADQLLRAFHNLIRNAAEATGPGGSIRIEVDSDSERRPRIRFEDDGPGIGPEQMASLFQPFHTTKPNGTGLGLALVHRIVETHRGEIRVDGRPGKGAAFTIVLPAAEAG